MEPPLSDVGAGAAPAWASKLHGALMPDYNRKATAYWWVMVALGTAALLFALPDVAALPLPARLNVFACMALASVAGFFPVKISRTNQAFSAGDLFIFLLLLMYGAPAACLAAAAEALVSAWRTSKRWTTRIGSATIAAVSMLGCGSLLTIALERAAGSALHYESTLLFATMVFGLTYFACNTILMTTTARLKRNDSLRMPDLLGVFGWVGISCAGTGALAALLYIAQRQAGLVVLLAIVPIIAMLFTTLHFFFRHQEAEEVVRQAQAAALERDAELASSRLREREAEQAARHVRELEQSEQRFHSAFTYASIGMALVSYDGRIRQANPALHILLGVPDAELGGRLFGAFVSDEHAPLLAAELARVTAHESDSIAVDLRCRTPAGDEVWVSINSGYFSEPGSAEPCLILQVQDTTARRRAEAELQHRAFHDKLTGLHNRDHFHERLAQAIAATQLDPRRRFAVLFIDFDRFKLINDSKGHNVGDEFLVQAARRLEQCLRAGDELARLGGDEFAILAGNLVRDDEAVKLAERLLVLLGTPLQLQGLQTAASASIGITFSSMGYSRPEDILRDADIAMYKAKVAGKARYALFDVKLHTDISNRVRLETDLRHALAERALTIAYQPIFELRSGRLFGFEALARWQHTELGPISAATFVAIAEESGLIAQLTEFILAGACRQLQEWHALDPAFAELTMHVNVAGPDIARDSFVPTVADAIAAAGLAPRHLTLELTENILMTQLAAAIDKLTALRALGVGLSVDDFGTGYSSLSHLSTLPIDSFKIDMSFVRHLHAGSKERAVIQAIVLLGKSLGKAVIAEGIETSLQLEQLRELGCDMGQGFHLARPLHAEAADRVLRERHADRAPGWASASTQPLAAAA